MNDNNKNSDDEDAIRAIAILKAESLRLKRQTKKILEERKNKGKGGAQQKLPF